MSGLDRPRRRRAVAEVSAGGVVFRRRAAGILYLLIRDPYGNWGLPKGHVEESDASLEEAARREVSEETGLPLPRIVHPLPTIDWYFRSSGRLIHKTCHFYLMESPSGEAVPQAAEGISACTWEHAADALATITYDNARAVLEAATRAVRELNAA